MDTKHKIEALQFLATIHRSEFENRRKVEWRAITLCFTFYVLALALRYKTGFTAPLWLRVLCGCGFVAVGLVTIAFSLHIHRSHTANKGIAQNAEHAILKLVNGNDPEEIYLFPNAVTRPSLRTIAIGGAGVYGWWCQSIIIMAFAFACALLFVVEASQSVFTD